MLFKEENRTNIDVSKIERSRFNARKMVIKEDVALLAERIARNGFEPTRAIWVYPDGDSYRVFAGGTRFEAAKKAGLKTIPVIVYEHYSVEEISKLSDTDNENDEYHIPVPITDIWAEYARLHEEEGWTQEKIAEVKDIDQAIVSMRLKLNELPDKIKDFMTQNFLTETHLRKMLSLRLESYFAPWLTTAQAITEMAEKVVQAIKKDGKKSVKAVQKDVADWKAWINHATEAYNSLESETTLYDMSTEEPTLFTYYPKESFVRELASRNARSLSGVKEAELAVKRTISESHDRYKRYIELKSTEAALEQEKEEILISLLSGFRYGDARKLIDDVENESVKLLLTDPPYGMDYQSNRRWVSKAPDKIQGDGNKEEASELLREVITKAIPKLTSDAHVLVFCSWANEPHIRDRLTEAGLKIKGSIIWEKEEHSAGDVKGSFAPCHERIIHAVKGSPTVSPRIKDVIKVSRAPREIHPFEKPVELLEKLINSTTNQSDVVLDPFAGSASTCKAAHKINRKFIGFENDTKHYDTGKEALLNFINKEGEIDMNS